MNTYNRLTLLVFLTPVFAALIYAVYYYESRHSLMNHLIKSGVIALFDGGMVQREDIRDYFLTPPADESSVILNALEMTPADLADFGMNEKDFELLQREGGQFLLSQVIKHLALVNYLNSLDNPSLPDSFDEDINAYREDLMLESMETDLARFLPTISRKEIMAYYIEHSKDYLRKGKRLAQYIMLDENTPPSNPDNPLQTTPKLILTRLTNGEDFQILLTQIRAEGSGNGGHLGWLERGALHHDFDRALWALEIGEVTGPIQISKVLDNGNELPQTEKTYHFIQLLDEQPEGLIPFNECREDIHSILEERERLTYRFKLLGIKDETLSADRNDQDGEYRNALLKAAYAREWDKNIVVVQKTEAYRRFHLADLLCQEKVDQVIKSQPVRTEEESIWVLRNETIDQILADMKFRILIKLDLPKSYNLSEDETSNLIQDE